MLQQVLDKLNLNFEDLNAIERQTLLDWMTALQAKTLSVDSIKEHVQQMKDSVEAELAGYTEPKTVWEFLFSKRKDIYRRARLRNYLPLLAFLTGPEKAQKAIERSLTNIKPKY
jgi:hypothetical protein